MVDPSASTPSILRVLRDRREFCKVDLLLARAWTLPLPPEDRTEGTDPVLPSHGRQHQRWFQVDPQLLERPRQYR